MADRHRKNIQTLENKLWTAVYNLQRRENLDTDEYKYLALGLIFLKFVSEIFDNYREAEKADGGHAGAAPEDLDKYRKENIFIIPGKAHWPFLRDMAEQSEIGENIDEAMAAIEKENPILKDVLPKIYARSRLGERRLVELIDLIDRCVTDEIKPVGAERLTQVFEYFLERFARDEAHRWEPHDTPPGNARLMVEMLQPDEGVLFDPCCGWGGIFVQSEKLLESPVNRNKSKKQHPAPAAPEGISIYGQAINEIAWRLCRMRLATRGVDSSNIKWNPDGSFVNDAHPDLKADFILADPPLGMEWPAELLHDDPRWKYGLPPQKNANFAWVQHIIFHLADTGSAGLVLLNSSLSSTRNIEGNIRQRIIEDDLVDCIITLPGQMLYSTQVPVCLWFLTKDKQDNRFRRRPGETLFIDARGMGVMTDRRRRELSAAEIQRIAGIYHAWRGREKPGTYNDIPGLCKSAAATDIKNNDYVLTPWSYVGVEAVKENEENFELKMKQLTAELEKQLAESSKIEAEILSNLKRLIP